MDLPVCRWRGVTLPGDRHACASPALVVGDQGVPDALCVTCHCRDRPPSAPAPVVQRCPHLGRRIRDEAGRIQRRYCEPCGGAALELFGCGHPATAEQVTLHDCQQCPYQPGRTAAIERVYLINLRSRADRLAAFRGRQKSAGWALPEPEIVPAIAGDQVGVPPYFRQGGGAWGCLRSHIGILERCIMEEVESVLVVEDDVEWFPEAWDRLGEFMDRVPSDWSQLMLGGQHIGPTTPTAVGVVRCSNTQRTHAYVVRGLAMRSLLKAWYSCAVHLDWVMGGDWQRGWPVYAPDPFIFGQSGGKSDISGRLLHALYWNPPTNAIVMAIDAPRSVVEQLRTHGLHFGFRRNSEGIDVGLSRVKAAGYPHDQLSAWLSTLLWEVASMRGRVTAVWCPGMDLALVERVHGGRVVRIEADTIEECGPHLMPFELVRSYATSHVLLLRCDRQTAEAAVGFHRGYWIDAESGYDRGVMAAAGGDRVQGLRIWAQHTFEEAERMQSVPMVWHPAISAADCRAAFPDRTIVEIEAARPSDLEKEWIANVH
jgi:hypothetical protein